VGVKRGRGEEAVGSKVVSILVNEVGKLLEGELGGAHSLQAKG